MNHGRFMSALSLLGLVLLVAGCGTDSLRSIQIIPAAGTQVLSSPGEQAQFKATGTFKRGSHPETTQDITSLVTWSSSDTAVATISSSGLATAGSTQGTTIITASLNGNLGLITGTSDLAVTGQTAGAPGPLSLSIIPGSQSVQTVGETGQFIAIGAFSSPTAVNQDLTNKVAWKSSDVKVAIVDASGLVTAVNPGTTTITAIGIAASGAVITATSTFTFNPQPGGPVNLATLTVYDVGNGGGTVTSPVPGGSTLLINCGTGSGCVGNYTVGSTVVLTETPQAGSVFGGWSSNCTPINATQCQITMSNNDTVGAIFNAIIP